MSKRKPSFKAQSSGFLITPTQLQKELLNLITAHQLTVLLGDPGTTKSHVALMYGLKALEEGQFEKIIISKPPVESGQSVGFLPGTLDEKLLPYKESYLDIITGLIGEEAKRSLLNSKKIVFEPIGFVRSKTFSNAFIILDEAQNCRLKDLMSFFTRKDDSSKMILLGDDFQADIKDSGLISFCKICEGIPGICIKELGEEYQMRSELIKLVYKKYKEYVLSTKKN